MAFCQEKKNVNKWPTPGQLKLTQSTTVIHRKMPATSNLAEALRGREPGESRVAKNQEDPGRTFSNEPILFKDINFGDLNPSPSLHASDEENVKADAFEKNWFIGKSPTRVLLILAESKITMISPELVLSIKKDSDSCHDLCSGTMSYR